jgi:flagellar hook-length control protein FliK
LRGLAGRDDAEAAGATETSDALAREAATSLGTAEFSLPAEARAARGAEPGNASPAGAGRVDAALATAATGAAPDTAPAAAAPVEVPLPTPPTSPDFPAALALRLTTLATDGVQQASLQLNPADMGPIAVQIVVDGSQAQIDFSAAHAQTREALAASLPALAASLHAAGLTLTGGGVSDQRPGARDGTPGSRGEGGLRGVGDDGPDASLAGAAALPRAAQRGLLDLYA